jgi:rhodanese-related sulfurtransferase
MPRQGMQQPMPGRGAMPQGYPRQGGPGFGTAPGGPGNSPGYGKRPGGPKGGDLDHLARMERRDFGVRPTARLHRGRMHGPTPASIPGGQVITTKGFVELLRRRQPPVLILDVLGGSERIPGAQNAVPAHQAGSFKDQTQRQFGQYLARATRGNKQHALVLYCASPQCWMSYNAALRAINMGYTNVLWYRGGIEFWKRAGQRVERAR